MNINYLKLLLGVCFFTVFFSCEDNLDNLQINENSNDHKSEWLGEYKKEIVVKDSTGENSIYLAIYSDNEQTLESYLAQNLFQVITTSKTISEIKALSINTNNTLKSSIDSSNYNLEMEPTIYVEVIATNIKANVEAYYLDIQKSNLKDVPPPGWSIGYPVSFVSGNWDNFMSITFLHGWDMYVYAGTKDNEWNLSYQDVYWSPLFIGPYNGHGAAWVSGSYYKIAMTIYPHIDQTSQNYRIAFSKKDFKDARCSYIGTYDGAHCYIGTAPTGTSAFYNAGSSGLYVYYTSINGTCPYLDAYYDGANCYVGKYGILPSEKENDAFIWNNSWYVDLDCYWPEYE